METQATPSSSRKRNKGSTPKNRNSPGDLIGIGKTQIPITRYFSPVSSSGDNSSQPYSPISCRSRTKRSRADSRSKKRLSVSRKTEISSLSDDSDDVFSVQTNSKPGISSDEKSRLPFVKRRLYPVLSEVPSSCSSSQTKQLRRRNQVLSDSESEDPMENSPAKLESLRRRPSTEVKKRLTLETSSQVVILSSSDGSDFELHNSKQSQCGKTPTDRKTTNGRTSLGVIALSSVSASDDSNFGIQYLERDESSTCSRRAPLSEFLNVSHISCSDNSNSSCSRDAILRSFNCQTLESSGIIPMTSTMDASDLFSNDVSSSGVGGSSKDIVETPGNVNFDENLSPTDAIVNIALEVAAIYDTPISSHENQSRCDGECVPGKYLPDSLFLKGEVATSTPLLSRKTSVLANPVDDSVSIKSEAEHANLNLDKPDSSSDEVQASGVNPQTNCSNTASENTLPSFSGEDDTSDFTTSVDTLGTLDPSVGDENETAALKTEIIEGNAASLQSADVSANFAAPETVSKTALAGLPRPENTEIPSEIKIVCGSLPNAVKLNKNADKFPKNRPLLLSAVISECKNYADHILDQEPIKTFELQYSNLPLNSKLLLNGCLVELLDSNRWMNFPESSAPCVENLVSSGIFQYNGFTKHQCESLQLSDLSVQSVRIVKLTESALFSIKICLELFALPLNLCDKLYKIADIAKFANSLISNVHSNKIFLLPYKMSKIVEDASCVLRDLGNLCRVKSGVFGSELNDESIYARLNDICSSIAVLDVSAELDPSVKNNPFYRFLVSNYVHALDDQLKTLLHLNKTSDFGACVYFAVLLKQSVTGYELKVKWCRERMRHLMTLFDDNVFEELSRVLKEPVNPVQFIVRSEFVSSSLKMKKLRLSLEEKVHLTQLLRPVSHKTTQLRYMPLNSLCCYPVLSKKSKGKNLNIIRANIFEAYKSDFPYGVEDNGILLFNATFLAFWPVIYQNLDGAFLNKFQNCPIDWGSEEFFTRRQNFIAHFTSEMKNLGLAAILKSMTSVFEKFSSHRCIVDWALVGPNISELTNLVETLGLNSFLTLSAYLLESFDERIVGFPDLVLWNPESKRLKFLGFRKPADPLYPNQILWMETLSKFGLDAEELQLAASELEQCSQLEKPF